MRQGSFGQAMRQERERLRRFRTIRVPIEMPRRERIAAARTYERFPYVPSDPSTRDERCAEVYEIQVQGLAKRLESAGVKHVVIGISGGLDSTQALLVCAQAMDRLGLPRGNILAYTMPGFATSTRTLAQARRLMKAIGCEANEMDIRPACLQMLKDIGHPYVEGRKVYDVTFENVQAGERTSHLFRLANLRGGLVVGTGDLSELALGWCTYGVGDHMSHYAVNASVPKTLIRHVIRWVAETERRGRGRQRRAAGNPRHPGQSRTGAGQRIGFRAGPGHRSRYRSVRTAGLQSLLHAAVWISAARIAFMAWCAWSDRLKGGWPDIPVERRNQYGIGAIKDNLRIFVDRFFALSQYKRSCIPNAPKVGSGGSLSPRGDYRAPSDGEAAVWREDLELIPDAE